LKVAEGITFHWKGYYEYDLNIAHTVKNGPERVREFRPRPSRIVPGIPLRLPGNIDPKLQLDILAQVREPKIVALDTMNFWIEKSPQLLRK